MGNGCRAARGWPKLGKARDGVCVDHDFSCGHTRLWGMQPSSMVGSVYSAYLSTSRLHARTKMQTDQPIIHCSARTRYEMQELNSK